MVSPRKISVKKPVKLIFTGGFLGSGKTTALASLARKLIRLEKRVGIVTNDQSENLVDTVIVKQMIDELGVPVEEVVEGCFCCKFDELIDHMEKIMVHGPDVLLGEPVGSCTDFVAAVANPIKIHYKDEFRFAPFSTMVDPHRVREFMLDAGRDRHHIPGRGYIPFYEAIGRSGPHCTEQNRSFGRRQYCFAAN